MIQRLRNRLVDLVLSNASLQDVFDFTGKRGEIVRHRGRDIQCRNIDEWSRVMRLDGAWGDSSVVQIFANITGITVHVVPTDQSQINLTTHYCPRQGTISGSAFPMCLGYGHCQVLVTNCLPTQIEILRKEVNSMDPVIKEVEDTDLNMANYLPVSDEIADEHSISPSNNNYIDMSKEKKKIAHNGRTHLKLLIT